VNEFLEFRQLAASGAVGIVDVLLQPM
jgi:hypothetical protein